jgi:hypothetical protein
MLIDIHAHTSVHKLWELHVDSASISDLEEAADRHGIKKIVLMATYFPFKKSGLKNDALLERIKGHDRFLMFGSLDIMNDFAAGLAELERLAENHLIAGIKLYPGYQDFSASDEAVYPVYRLAEKYRLPVMFHSGELHGCCPHSERAQEHYRCESCQIERLQYQSKPAQMIGAIQAFPGVNFILSHLGNPYFAETRKVMAECPNAFTDISGQFVSGRAEEDTPEYRREIIEEIKKVIALPRGIDRLLFGTDFPIQSYEDSISLIKALGLTAADEQKIFHDNAVKILHL